MHNWHRQNSYIIFDVITLHINTFVTSVKKSLDSSQIEFTRHAVEIWDEMWPAWSPHHYKTVYHEGATSDDEIRRSRYRCQVWWLRWMWQLFKSNVLNYDLCNTRHVRQWMSMDGQGTKRRRNIAENFNPLSRPHER